MRTGTLIARCPRRSVHILITRQIDEARGGGCGLIDRFLVDDRPSVCPCQSIVVIHSGEYNGRGRGGRGLVLVCIGLNPGWRAAE